MPVWFLADLLFSRLNRNRSQSTESFNFTLVVILRWSKLDTHSRVSGLNGIFSIVAVHGLYGNALQTWTSDQSKALWLRDAEMLPKAVPNARILTWGYNADVHAFLGHTSSDRIMQHAHTLVAQLQTDREVCLASTLHPSLLAISPNTMLLSATTHFSWSILLTTSSVVGRCYRKTYPLRVPFAWRNHCQKGTQTISMLFRALIRLQGAGLLRKQDLKKHRASAFYLCLYLRSTISWYTAQWEQCRWDV